MQLILNSLFIVTVTTSVQLEKGFISKAQCFLSFSKIFLFSNPLKKDVRVCHKTTCKLSSFKFPDYILMLTLFIYLFIKLYLFIELHLHQTQSLFYNAFD